MTNDDDLPLNGPAVDYNKVPSLNHVRSVNFVNNFIVNTTHFLNNFSTVSEQRLAQQSLEIQKLEVAINILEAKLNSVPGLNDVAPTKETPVEEVSPAPQESASHANEENVVVEPVPVEDVLPPPNLITAKQDPRYARYFKMVAVGVPKVAIEGKMRLEGLDPSFLDNPDAPVPDAGEHGGESEDSDNESRSLSSDDDFSD